MSKQAEARLVNRILKAVRERYPRAWCEKLADKYARGRVDVLIIFPRRCLLVPNHDIVGVLHVECKIDSSTSAIQKAEHSRIQRLAAIGSELIIARDVASVTYVMEQMGAV